MADVSRRDEADYVTYSALPDRPVLSWPNGARVALWVCPNVEHYEFMPPTNPFRIAYPRVPQPDVMSYASRDFGNRVGFWRMLEVLDAHGVRATVSLNVAVLEHFPEVRDAMIDRGWEFMSHGIYNTRFLYGLSEEEERKFYEDVSAIVARTTGQQVKGMLGPAFSATSRTPQLMAEAGLIYQADWFIDDQPFPIHVEGHQLVGVPYSREVNDALVLSPPGLEADDFAQMCRDQFDVLYEEGRHSGRVMCIPLHPFLMGQPHRIHYLDEILAYVLSHDGVWQTTGSEIAEYYLSSACEQHRTGIRT